MPRKVLLVEDDNAIAIVIRAALEDEGFIVEATDSVAGRDRLLAQAAFHVMLTDVMLTDGDGLETLGAVRAEVLENFFLSDHLRAAQIPLRVVAGRNLINVRLYPEGWGAVVRGWTKAFVRGAGGGPKS